MQAIYGKKLQILSTYAALLHLMEKQPAQATPVSYTHLDVYKRQVLSTTKFPFLPTSILPMLSARFRAAAPFKVRAVMLSLIHI